MTGGDRECERDSEFAHCDNWLVAIDEQLVDQLLARGYDANTMLLHCQDLIKYYLIRQNVIEITFANWLELVKYMEEAIEEVGKTSVQEIATIIATHSFEFFTADPATIDNRAGGEIRIRVRRSEDFS